MLPLVSCEFEQFSLSLEVVHVQCNVYLIVSAELIAVVFPEVYPSGV